MLFNPHSVQRKPVQSPPQGQKTPSQQLMLNKRNMASIVIPNSQQVSPVNSDSTLRDFKMQHSHKGSQIDVSNLTKLMKQSKQSTSESTSNSSHQIQLLLAKAKEIQLKTAQSGCHSRKESQNDFQLLPKQKQTQSDSKLPLHSKFINYPSLKELMSNKVSPKSGNEHSTLCRNTFNFEFVIGIGGFGKVWKVEYKKTGQAFAMKEMSKALVITKKSVNSVMNERTLLSTLKHQFLINMHYAYQDRENLYLLMDYMKGGDLRYHIGRMRRFSEEQTRFFIACIFLGLEYVHTNNIIHRDIKPENLVLDEQGYVRITDFGIARQMKPENSNDTSGTPGYMAPEVMYRQNHSFAVDYYAMGVIAYEFMLGRRPYIGRSRQEIRDQIIAKQVQIKRGDIPEGWSLEGADFINKLIQRKPQNRLGFNGSQEVRQHVWFTNFPWEQLQNFDLNPPFIPNQSEDNFDQKQIIIEDEENSDLIQQNTALLRDNSVQDMFNGYEYYGNLLPSTSTEQSSSSSNKHCRNFSQNVEKQFFDLNK